MNKIIKYITEDGECPLDEFIKELIASGCKNDVQKINAYIQLLETNGKEIIKNSNWVKKLNSTIYELRPRTNRVLFFIFSNDEFILLHGFKKKTQKTPINEINKALNEAHDFERRNCYGNKKI